MRRRSYSPSPPRGGYDRRGRSPSPRGRHGGRGRDLPTSLLVRNLRHDCRQDDLRRPFGQFGPLKDIYLPKDYYTGEPRGFGFVQYVDPTDAAEAKYHMDGQVLLSREVTVVFAEENRKKPSDMRQRERGRGRYRDRRRSPPRYSRSPPPRQARPASSNEQKSLFCFILSFYFVIIWLILASYLLQSKIYLCHRRREGIAVRGHTHNLHATMAQGAVVRAQSGVQAEAEARAQSDEVSAEVPITTVRNPMELGLQLLELGVQNCL
ncbi:Serine/arginine-rich splicing factor 10 [Morus notabilis]|uniref:Serine/arginine-rich splicing factor 10 n=1 Tax=Morus notabilis TaxID=981085 RepID=W9R5E2_9ROSA|nr:Serine/arginine-rich splicing factor 10 [Morus notabilis]